MIEDRNLYKIISGRYTLFVSGLYLYVVEPNSDLISQSYDVYDYSYNEACLLGSYTDPMYKNFLGQFDIWTPTHQAIADGHRKTIENLKVDAYKNFFKTKELKSIKSSIRRTEAVLNKMMDEKAKYDYLTAHNVAERIRNEWLLERCTYIDGELIGDRIPIQYIYGAYVNNLLTNEQIRGCSKLDSWRIMWSTNKSQGGVLFNKNPTDYSRDQLVLCSFTQMMDNALEHPDCPSEDVLNDDDCLDGWFIVQKRKREEEKKSDTASRMTSNPKISKAKEQFFLVNSQEDAENVYNMNSEKSRNIIQQRQAQIANSGKINDSELLDQRIEILNSMNTQRKK